MNPSRIAARMFAFGLSLGLMLAAAHAAGAVFSSTLPASRSVQTAQPATFFATMVATAGDSASNCAVTLASGINATLSYQMTNPTTNAPIGIPNTPAAIAAGGSQSFVVTLTANADIPPTDVQFGFGCNEAQAPVFPGLNTLLFSASSTPVPDIIALAATVGSTGIVEVPKDDGFGFFTVATINIGAGANIQATATTTGAQATQILLCETDPQGVCLDPPTGATVQTTIAANTTPTFAVFVRSTPTVAFDPANNRVFVAFRQNGATRGSTSVAFRGGGQTAAGVFNSLVSPNTVQTKCIACHFTGGAATLTRLIFQPGNSAATLDHNFNVFKNFVATVPGAGDLIRNKVQGALAHGGGVQVNTGTQEFANLSRFLDLLGAEASAVTLSPATLFNTVGMLSRQRTLRAAALLLAGRLPNPDEIAAVDAGDDTVLRATIRGVMQGEAFHDFLIEGANDRLLTDRELRRPVITSNGAFFVNYTQREHELLLLGLTTNDPDDREYWRWYDRTNFGLARAPLELIAHVVMNDAPYTEVLTADYIMGNPFSAEAYGGAPVFNDPNDTFEFKPARIVDYYRTDDSKKFEYSLDTNTRIIDRGNLHTDNYPHAGILTTNAFLKRYPSTATNRNRARSRWTYYHFLGVDIEKSATRTTDPVALADKNNPTMNNQNCTVCHQRLDPVAGAFQDFGDDGLFRDQHFGLDSLDHFYKYPEGGGTSIYVPGDLWYRDMRTPAFGGATAPTDGSSLPWLAAHIVADPRFATATVRFWWPAVMGTPALEPPEVQNDPNFNAMLLGFSAQNAEIDRLAARFRGSYDLKDLLVELIMSPWFRATTETSGDPTRQIALAAAGIERLLTPEQLERKTRAVTGLSWGGWQGGSPTYFGARRASGLTHQYRQFYGGIDSDGVTKRATELNAVMASVAQTHAAEMSCPVVMRELLMLPPSSRLLFGGIDRNVTPLRELAAQYDVEGATLAERATYSQTGNLSGNVRITAFFANDYYDDVTKADRNLMLDRLVIRGPTGAVVYSLEYQHVASVSGYQAGCGAPQGGQFNLWSSCEVSVPWTVPAAGAYTIEVSAWGQQAGPQAPRLVVSVDGTSATAGTTQGALQIKHQLAALSRALYSADVTATSPEVERLYQLLVAVWQRKSAADTGRWLPGQDLQCNFGAVRDFFVGFVDNAVVTGDYGEQFDWTAIEPYLDALDTQDPAYMLQTWVVVMTAMLNDYRYLYL